MGDGLRWSKTRCSRCQPLAAWTGGRLSICVLQPAQKSTSS
jgi:hypothetical protein